MEPYLCVGGVEVAYHRRTLAYLRNVGHHGLAAGCGTINPDCGCELRCTTPGVIERNFTGCVRLTIDDPDVWKLEPRLGAFPPGGLASPVALSYRFQALPAGSGTPVTVPDWDDPVWGLQTDVDGVLLGSYAYGAYDALLLIEASLPTIGYVSKVAVFIPADMDQSVWSSASVGIFPPPATGDTPVWFELATADTIPGSDISQVCGWAQGLGVVAFPERTVEVTVEQEAVEAGYRYSVDATGGTGDGFSLEMSLLSGGSEDEPPCTCAPPPTPPPADDPAWVFVAGPVDLPVGTPYLPYPDPGDSVLTTWAQWILTDKGNGARYRVLLHICGCDLAPGNVPVMVSFDEGRTLQRANTMDGAYVEECPPFETPAADNAPWYDPAVPESADVLGVWLNDLTMSTPWKRQMRDRTWGGSLGTGKLVGREIVVSGVVFTRSCCATEYARQWLFEALQGGACFDGPCGLPDVNVYTCCDPDDRDRGLRTIKRVGVTDFQWQQDDDDFPCCWGAKFEATLSAEVPYLYRLPETVFDGPIVDLEIDPVCGICEGVEDRQDTCACGCADVAVRVADSEDDDDCWCAPVQIRRQIAVLDSPLLWTDATAVIRIRAGDDIDPGGPGLKNLRIRAWPNPLGLAADDVTADHFGTQKPCLEIDVACIPRGGELVIDGTTRQATVLCAGERRNGYAYLSSAGGTARFAWPEIACYGLVLFIDTDAVHTAPDTRMAIDVVGRERA